MVNYCVDWKEERWFGHTGTFIFDSYSERNEWLNDKSESYRVIKIYENEDCYCHAYSENECGCGNFR